MEQTDYNKSPRSQFWLSIKENDNDSVVITVSKKVVEVVKYHFPELESAGPNGWKEASNNSKNESIWIPGENRSDIDLDEFKNWADFSGNKCIWLKITDLLSPYFGGTELDYCIAADFRCIVNGAPPWPKSPIGEAEYQLKYNISGIADLQQKAQFEKVLSDPICKMVDLLPLADRNNVLISPVPMAPVDQNKLAWRLSKHVATVKGVQFLNPQLTVPKLAAKDIGWAEKLALWKRMYETPGAVEIPSNVLGKAIIIVDDLYQSGVTVWSYARYLRQLGAISICALAAVKSMNDKDNTKDTDEV